MAAVAREEYDLEDPEYMEAMEDDELDEKQRRILAAMQSAQGLGLEDLQESEEIMRQIYEENLYFQQNQKLADSQNHIAEQDQILALRAEALASSSGLDPAEALKILKEQQKQAQLNPPPVYDPRLSGLAGVEEGDVLNGMIAPNQAMALSAGIDMNQMSLTEEQAQQQYMQSQNQLNQL